MHGPETLTDWAALITIVSFLIGASSLPTLAAWIRGRPDATDTVSPPRHFPLRVLALLICGAVVFRVPPMMRFLAFLQGELRIQAALPAQPTGPVEELSAQTVPRLPLKDSLRPSPYPIERPQLPITLPQLPVEQPSEPVPPPTTSPESKPPPQISPWRSKPGIAAVRTASYHNVRVSGQSGMAINVRFNAENLERRRLYVAVYFFFSSGSPLRDIDGTYKSGDGQVSTGASFIPRDQRATGNVTLEIPYAELHVAPRTHSNLGYRVLIFDRDAIEGSSVLYASTMRPFYVD